MRRLDWQVRLGLFLAGVSAVVYLVHFLIFEDFHHIAIYLVGDIAFVPMEVLLVTVVIHEMLSRREKQAKLRKLNMVVGAFFSEVGTPLLHSLARFDAASAEAGPKLLVSADWSRGEFSTARRFFKQHEHDIDARSGDLEGLKVLLRERRDFLLRLLENPNLLEHETFTELLWAVFHLTEELGYRADLKALPDSDLKHLAGDIRRAYGSLVAEWLAYMEHLKADYPYLFSLALRTNPFDERASAVVS